MEGFAKPGLVAPGSNIVSLSPGNNSTLAVQHPANIVNSNYFRMSGTSMSAAVTSGAVALLLQNEPNLNPDQVKYRLMATARPLNAPGAGAGMLDVYAAAHATSLQQTANTGTAASQLLWGGSAPVNWTSVNWSSVNWSSDTWNP